MTTMASQITSLAVVYSTVYSDADQRKHQSSTSLAFVWGIHRDRWIPRTKGQLRGKCFHLMTSSWFIKKLLTKISWLRVEDAWCTFSLHCFITQKACVVNKLEQATINCFRQSCMRRIPNKIQYCISKINTFLVCFLYFGWIQRYCL